LLKIVEAYDRRPIAEVETEGADALEVKLEKAARCFRDRDQWLEPQESELKEGSTDPGPVKAVGEFYRANQIPADSVARAIAYAIEQPFDVDINEIVLRPTSQEF
jgi:hypothetical protein